MPDFLFEAADANVPKLAYENWAAERVETLENYLLMLLEIIVVL